MIKIVASSKLEAYRNTFLNLSTPMLTMSEPAPPKQFKFNEKSVFTVWDKIEINGKDKSVSKIFGEILEQWGLVACDIYHGSRAVYLAIRDKSKKNVRS